MHAFIFEVWIQLRKYAYLIIGSLVVLVACDVAGAAFTARPVVTATASIVRMLAWCLVACLMAFELYRYANGGDD